jgi:hypothetical protein
MPAPLPGAMIGVDIRNAPVLFGSYPILAVPIRFTGPVAAQLVDQSLFLCPTGQSWQVVAADEVHAVASNDAGAVNLQFTKDTGTQAPGAGVDLLTNNTAAGFNLKGTANTPQLATLTATAADLTLAAWDRLSIDFAGTIATLAGVVATAWLKRIS